MNYNPVPLGSAKDIKTLSIRGTSLVASPTQLQDKLQQINREATANPNKNAVLIIGEYEGVRTPWNITVAWRSPNSPSEVATFSAKATQRQLELDFLALKSADERLRSIQSTKVLGNDIAQKANMICNANYAAGQKLGKINLCENLKRNLVKPEYIIDVRMIGKTSPNLEPTLQDIKTTIDSLYRTLQKYMQSGWAHKI